jgi:hypothetical protein
MPITSGPPTPEQLRDSMAYIDRVCREEAVKRKAAEERAAEEAEREEAAEQLDRMKRGASGPRRSQLSALETGLRAAAVGRDGVAAVASAAEAGLSRAPDPMGARSGKWLSGATRQLRAASTGAPAVIARAGLSGRTGAAAERRVVPDQPAACARSGRGWHGRAASAEAGGARGGEAVALGGGAALMTMIDPIRVANLGRPGIEADEVGDPVGRTLAG